MMAANLFFLTVLTFLVCSIHAQNDSEDWQNNTLITENNVDMPMLQNLRQDVMNLGCSINLCFVMDASDVVSNQEFLFQKNFIDLIMAITTTDRPGTYCAAQYHNSFTEISPLTRNRDQFLRRVFEAEKKTGGGNVTPGLRYAVNQLVKRKGAANKIVLFSRKKPFISRFLPPVVLKFFNINGTICSVALKQSNKQSLADNITGDPNLVFPRDGFFELSEVIFSVVHTVCDMDKADH